MANKRWLLIYAAATLVAFGLGVAVALGTTTTLVAVGGVLLLLFVLRRPGVLIVPLVLGGIVLMRPSWLGQNYTPVGVALIVAAGLLAAFEDHLVGSRQSINRGSRSLVLWVGLFSVWLCVIPAIHTGASLDYVRSALYVMLTMFAGVLVLRDPSRASKVARAVVWLSVAFCVSFAVTLLWWGINGPMSGELFRVPIPGYLVITPQPVYLPFTPTSSLAIIAGVPIPRLLGYMREPGLFQAVLLWSFFMVKPLAMRRRRLVYGLLLLGIAGTQSTAGFAIFLAVVLLTSFVVNEASRRGPEVMVRQLFGVVVAVFAGWVAFKAPILGIDAKQAINAGSISDRSTNAWAGLSSLGNYPFGQNLYGGSAVQFSSINLLASSILIGVPGLVFGLMAYFRPIFLAHNRVRAAKLLLPIGFTALIAQPVTGAPAFWLLCLTALCLDQVQTAPEKPAVKIARSGQNGGTRPMAVRL
jgi:hypothetical protein